MNERFPWEQIIILLLIFGGSILKFIFQSREAKEEQQRPASQLRSRLRQAGRPPQAKSPALEILDKIREQNESVIAPEARARASAPQGQPDPEDAYYGDDELEGATGLQATEIPASRAETHAPPYEAPPEVTTAPVKQEAAQKKRRSGDRIPGTIRSPREEILQPHSTDLQTGISAPRTSGEKVRKQDLNIGEGLAIHTSTASGARRKAASLRLPSSLGGGQLSLKEAIIAQLVLGPPKALEKQNRGRPGRIHTP